MQLFKCNGKKECNTKKECFVNKGLCTTTDDPAFKEKESKQKKQKDKR